jgi:hypothetical protein
LFSIDWIHSAKVYGGSTKLPLADEDKHLFAEAAAHKVRAHNFSITYSFTISISARAL